MKNIRFQLMNHILSRKYSKYYQLCDSLALAVEPVPRRPAHLKAAGLKNHKQYKCVCLLGAALSLLCVSVLRTCQPSCLEKVPGITAIRENPTKLKTLMLSKKCHFVKQNVIKEQ